MKWYSKYLYTQNKSLAEIDEQKIDLIRQNIANLQSNTPLVTVSVIAFNEEKRLLSCLWSLSEMKCKFPVEIIGVNNNSTDRTEDVFKITGTTYYNEKKPGCGHARACGLQHAKGKYHINIDADTMYPPYYIQTMIEALEKENIVGVNSSWGYIPDKNHSWLSIKLYEFTRDIYLYLQSFKRPELSVRGMVFGYRTNEAKKVGIRTDIIRGEDGSLALALKKYGKIKFIHSSKAKAITGYGTVSADGTFFNSFKIRALKGIKNMGGFFSSKKTYKDNKNNLIK